MTKYSVKNSFSREYFILFRIPYTTCTSNLRTVYYTNLSCLHCLGIMYNAQSSQSNFEQREALFWLISYNLKP